MKKILSLVLALVMTISCASFAFAAPAIDEDAKDLSVYQDSIDFLAKMDLYKGGAGLSDADAITRWMMALFVARITTGWIEDSKWESSIENYSGFSDIDADLEQYLGAISYASQMGIIEGYGDGRFGPKDGIQYQQALKMLCCALGYTKVDGGYPWGYIQKAVNIGLTNVIGEQGLAPTDVLCRAEVGQLIYNALFAETAKGGTLAQNVFGKDYEWVNVMITATDKVAALNGTAKAAADKVGFTVIENGALTEETYEAAEKLFALDANWAAEKALGTTFKVLLENGVATNAIPYATTEVTVRAGEGNIKSYVDAINGFKLQQFSDAVKYDVIDTEAGSKLAIDWTNGHILEKDGDDWKVLWYYNALLGKYFQVVENGAIDGVVDTILGEVVGIKYMTDADAAALKAKFEEAQYKKVDGNGFVKFEAKNIANYAYADLDVIDTVGAGFDRGYFKGYSFGKITVAKTHDNKNALVTIKDYSNILADAGTVLTACDKHDCGSHVFGWIEDASVLGANGYAIYSYNAVTGEIEIACTEKSANFEWLTNVKLETYNAAKGTVTLDGDVLDYGYDKLDGVMFNANEQEYSAYLYNNFNQYVNVLLVDGNVVYMEIDKNAGFDGYIIVDGFAGYSSHGYIVVNGYNTKDLKYDQFLIESYNGWKQGDYFYNLSAAKLNETFKKGAIYTVASTTTLYGETLYNVNVLDEIPLSTKTLDIDAKYANYNYILIDEDYSGANDATPALNKSVKVVVINDSNATGVIDFSVFEGVVTNTNWALRATKWAKIDGAYVVWTSGATVTGFAKDQSNVSIVLYTNSFNTKVEYNADENKDWYILGSTKYVTKAWDIFAGDIKEVYGYNLNLKVGKAYVTVDDQIITATDFFSAYAPTLGTDVATEIDKTELYAKIAGFYTASAQGYKNAKYIIGTIADIFDADSRDGATAGIVKDGKNIDAGLFSKNVMFSQISTDSAANVPDAVQKSFVSGVSLYYITTNDAGFNGAGKAADAKLANLPATFKVTEKTYTGLYIYDVETKAVKVYVGDWTVGAVTPAPAPTTPEYPKTVALDIEPVIVKTITVGTGINNATINIMAQLDIDKHFTDASTYTYQINGVKYFFEDGNDDTTWVADAATNPVALAKLVAEGLYFGTVDNQVKYDVVINGTTLNYTSTINVETIGEYVMAIAVAFDDMTYTMSDVNTNVIKDISILFGILDDTKSALVTGKFGFYADIDYPCDTGVIATDLTVNAFNPCK